MLNVCVLAADADAFAELSDDHQYEEIEDADRYDDDGYLTPRQQETSFQETDWKIEKNDEYINCEVSSKNWSCMFMYLMFLANCVEAQCKNRRICWVFNTVDLVKILGLVMSRKLIH